MRRYRKRWRGGHVGKKRKPMVKYKRSGGAAVVACVNTGRNFIGIEHDAHYFSVAKERIEKAQKHETD